MAKIPVKIDPRSERNLEVTVIVYVDGKEYTQATHLVEEWAIPYTVSAAIVQIEDPDYEAARES
jgi:hypothetical protein